MLRFAGPFEEEDYAVDGAGVGWEEVLVGVVDEGVGVGGRWYGGYLSERIVSASREISSSNWTSLTPRFSMREVKTP